MKDTKTNSFLIRAQLIDWAYCVPIEGNAQSVEVARRILLFLCSVVGLDLLKSNYLACWYSVGRIAKELGYKRRRAYYAVERLQREGLVRVFPVKHANNQLHVLPDANYRRKFASVVAKNVEESAHECAKNLGEFAHISKSSLDIKNAPAPVRTDRHIGAPPGGPALQSDAFIERKQRKAYISILDQVAAGMDVKQVGTLSDSRALGQARWCVGCVWFGLTLVQ